MADEQTSGDRLGWEQPMLYIDKDGNKRFVLDLTPEQIAAIKQLHAEGEELQPHVLDQLARQGVKLDAPSTADRRRRGGVKIHIHRH